jgi:hypothetical protein
MTISLPAEVESRLVHQASRLGLAPDEYASRLIAQHLPPMEARASLGDLFAEWDREDATDDPAELARRNQEFEELKEAMNRNREEMEGPLSRKPWP